MFVDLSWDFVKVVFVVWEIRVILDVFWGEICVAIEAFEETFEKVVIEKVTVVGNVRKLRSFSVFQLLGRHSSTAVVEYKKFVFLNLNSPLGTVSLKILFLAQQWVKTTLEPTSPSLSPTDKVVKEKRPRLLGFP